MTDPASVPTLALLAAVVAVVAGTALLVQEIARRRSDNLLRRWEMRSQGLEQALAAAPDGWYAWLPSTFDKSVAVDRLIPLPSEVVAVPPSLTGGTCSRRLAVLLGLTMGQEAHFAHVLAGFDEPDQQRLMSATSALRGGGEAFEVTLSHFSDRSERHAESRRTLRITGRQALADDGQVIADIVWMHDVTADYDAALALSAEVRQLRRAQQRLQRAVDALPLPVWIRDSDLRIAFANNAFQRGVANEDMSPQLPYLPLPELAAGQTALEMRALASAARAAGQQRDGVFLLVLDGSLKQMAVSEIPLTHDKHDPDPELFTVGIALDKTPLSALEATLEHESASHANVLERLSTAIAIFGDDTRLHFHNAAFASLWRLDEGWLAERPRYSEFLETLRTRRLMPEVADWPAFRDVELARFKTLLDPLEDLLHLPDAQTLRRVLAPHPLGGLLATYENVTDRLTLEASLTTLAAVHRESLRHLTEAVAIFSAHGHVTLTNPAFCTLWNIAPEILLAEPSLNDLLTLLPNHESDSAIWDDVRRLLTAQPQDRAVRRHWFPRADLPPVAVTGIPLPDGGVMVTFMAAVG